MLLWHLKFLLFFVFSLIFKIKSGKIRPNFAEIFGNEWNKIEREEKVIKIEQKEENEKSAVDQMGEENINGPTDQQKIETIQKFEAIKEKLKQKGKYQWKNGVKIDTKIGKLLGANRQKIYKWKKEMNLNKNAMKKNFYEKKKKEFIERINEFKSLYSQSKQKEFVKELGISKFTFIKWKKELMPKYLKTQNKNSNDDKIRLMKQYAEIKETNPKIRDEIIAKKLGIGSATLIRWKKEFSSILADI